jgi:hypothetical protein
VDSGPVNGGERKGIGERFTRNEESRSHCGLEDKETAGVGRKAIEGGEQSKQDASKLVPTA